MVSVVAGSGVGLANAPETMEDHGVHAVSLACAMQARAAEMSQAWRGMKGPSGVGIGLSQGLATIGAIASGERLDYAAVGDVTNRAARLCDRSKVGQILVCQTLWNSLQGRVDGTLSAELHLKGSVEAEAAYNIHWDRSRAPRRQLGTRY